jgi:pyruvate formate lyase activating enzyme
MLDTARLAHEKGLKTVMVSNGYIQEAPLQQLIPYLDAANIDLKCFDETIYVKLTRGKLPPVLQTLERLKNAHVWLEITNLLVPGFSDQPEQITSMCQWLIRHGFDRTPLHFSRFFPLYKLSALSPTSASSLVEAKTIAEKAGLKYVYIGNVRGLNAENTRCPSCGAVLIMRDAYRVAVTGLIKNHCRHCGALLDGVWA